MEEMVQNGKYQLTNTDSTDKLITMEPSKRISYFNDLTVDLNDELYFSSEIYERTRDNPNLKASYPCQLCNDSLDEYAVQLTNKMLSALRI